MGIGQIEIILILLCRVRFFFLSYNKLYTKALYKIFFQSILNQSRNETICSTLNAYMLQFHKLFVVLIHREMYVRCYFNQSIT